MAFSFKLICPLSSWIFIYIRKCPAFHFIQTVKFWLLSGRHYTLGNDLMATLKTSSYAQWNVRKLLSPWVLIVTCQWKAWFLRLLGCLLLWPSAVMLDRDIIFGHWQFRIQWLPSLGDSERHKIGKKKIYFKHIWPMMCRMVRWIECQMGT